MVASLLLVKNQVIWSFIFHQYIFDKNKNLWIPRKLITSRLDMFWTHTHVFSRFPSNVYVTAEHSSPCHQLHWPTEEDIGAERTGDCVLVRGAAQGDPVMAWLMTPGLQNTSSSEPPMHSAVRPASCPFLLSIKQQWWYHDDDKHRCTIPSLEGAVGMLMK